MGVVQVMQSSRQVATRERCRAPRLPSVGVLGLLPALGEQLLASGVVLVGAVDRAHREQHHRPVGQRAGLPDQVAGAAQQRHRLLCVGQRFGVPAEQ
ncbi:MAG TPA: hypothetical protein VM712_10195, partial [Gaiellales bacterium]|nr:hypothetical protein [Gaiellales bacterium]